MPTIKRSKARKELEQKLFDLCETMKSLGIGKSEIISHIKWKGCGFVDDAKHYDRKRKFDAVNQALSRGWFPSELFAKRVIKAAENIIEERKEITEIIKKREASFLLKTL